MGADRPPGGRRPVRLLEWRERDDGRITVLRPKYGTGRLGRWISGRLSRPHCRVDLDDVGSFVWKQCDGRRSIQEIADALQAREREPAPDLHSRLSLFVRHLEREGMLGWDQERAVEEPPGGLNARTG